MSPLSVILLMHVTLGSVTINEIINRSTSTVVSLYYGYGPCHRKSRTAKDGPISNFNKTAAFQKLSIRYQASTPVELKPALLWDFIQRRLAVGHRRLGANYRKQLQSSSSPRRTKGTGGRVNGRWWKVTGSWRSLEDGLLCRSRWMRCFPVMSVTNHNLQRVYLPYECPEFR